MIRGNFIGAAIVAIIYTVYILMKPFASRSQQAIVLLSFAFK